MNEAIELLIQDIHDIYNETKRKLKPNIYRGHSRSISTDIEDHISIFISSLLSSNFKLLIDPSIHTNNRGRRPDLLIANENDEVLAMVEMKANMGYCRDARSVLNEMIDNHSTFINISSLTCKFSEDETQNVTYNNNVKLFLISLTSDNCSQSNHSSNKENAENSGIYYYNLFSGWYGSLQENQIVDFAEKIINL